MIAFVPTELPKAERALLDGLAKGAVISVADSPERLVERASLFLHRVEAQLPAPSRRMLDRLRSGDAPLHGKKVLVIDDDIRNVFALTSTLEQRGMKVVFAENGREGIERLHQHPNTDLVLLDIMMPEMDGYETARAIRSMSRFESLRYLPHRQSDEGRSREGDHRRRVGLHHQAGQHGPARFDDARLAGRVTQLATDAEQFDGREALAELTAGDLLPILLVDDRAENLSALRAVLAPLGLPVHTATSGYEALRMLLERDYALILLDVRMPGLDGLETARLIKSRTRTHDLPIVFLTAASDEVADIVRGYGVGAVDYVIKPFDSELLRRRSPVFAELERSRRALKRSEALLRGAFEAAPIGKTVLDPARRIVLANPAFGRLLRREPGTLGGVAVLDLCHPEDQVEGLWIGAHYQPAGAATEVGGDWYDAFALPGGRWAR